MGGRRCGGAGWLASHTLTSPRRDLSSPGHQNLDVSSAEDLAAPLLVVRLGILPNLFPFPPCWVESGLWSGAFRTAPQRS